jgi:hypothetical protein
LLLDDVVVVEMTKDGGVSTGNRVFGVWFRMDIKVREVLVVEDPVS